MSSDSTVNEISELLGSLRENAQYLGELGAETVELVEDRADEFSTAASVSAGSPNYKATATTSPRTDTRPDEFSTIKTRTTPISSSPQDTLFGDLRPPEPSLNQSSETLE